MENPIIIVNVIDNGQGYFVAKAIGYPGVITFGRSAEAAAAKIQEAWNAMAQFNAIKSVGNPKRTRHSFGQEVNVQLQLA